MDPSNNINPVLVGLARGIAEAVVIGALGGLAVAVSDLDLGVWNGIIPGVQAVVRTAEGWVDKRIDPTKQRGKLGNSKTGRVLRG